MARDYYAVLGVDKGASVDQIKRAYRRLARQLHPDVNPDQEARFKELAAVYEVLSDPKKRALVDAGQDPLDPSARYRTRAEHGASTSSYQDPGAHYGFSPGDNSRASSAQTMHEEHQRELAEEMAAIKAWEEAQEALINTWFQDASTAFSTWVTMQAQENLTWFQKQEEAITTWRSKTEARARYLQEGATVPPSQRPDRESRSRARNLRSQARISARNQIRNTKEKLKSHTKVIKGEEKERRKVVKQLRKDQLTKIKRIAQNQRSAVQKEKDLLGLFRQQMRTVEERIKEEFAMANLRSRAFFSEGWNLEQEFLAGKMHREQQDLARTHYADRVRINPQGRSNLYGWNPNVVYATVFSSPHQRQQGTL